jgi:hypothetical protein
MPGKKPLTDEQKRRNNERRQEKRLIDKMNKTQKNLEQLQAIKLPEPEKIEITEDLDEIERKKLETTEKRRKALEKARSMRVKPSDIRKQKEMELNQIKEQKEMELNQIKEQKEMELNQIKEQKDIEISKMKEEIDRKPKVKIIKKYINNSLPSVPKKKKNIIANNDNVPNQNIDYLAQQSYAEQLKIQFNKMLYNKISTDTFG